MTLEKIDKMNSYLIGFLKILYLNLLWLGFTLLGLVVFGIGPATYALTKYYDQWLRLKNEPHVTRSFYQYYKERFWQSCLVTLVAGGAIGIVVVNFFYAKNYYIRIVNMVFIFLLLIGFSHIFKVMVATNFQKFYEIVRGSFLLGFGYLLQTVVAWVIIIGVYLLLAKLMPILIFILGISFVALILTVAGNIIIKNLYRTDVEPGKEVIK